MERPKARGHFGRGRGILSASGTQVRFILFLIFLLVIYTLLLKVFQKLAVIVDLPLFVPIALAVLLIFIGVAGTLYSHRFAGPMVRIRKTLQAVAHGDCSVALRVREADDPALKELAATIGDLCEHERGSRELVQNAAMELTAELDRLDTSVQAGASAADLRSQMEVIRKKQIVLEQVIRSMGC